ncbi:MAG: phosphoadenylylsulfate reductase [Lutibacter sp.]|nr:MAG: phosphoadenylylsulfate reductase [Lutibacter sp.]
MNLEKSNKELKNRTPEEIIAWAIKLNNKRIVTTSFGIYSAVLLNTFSKMDKEINVIWCDTSLNTIKTYEHARLLIKKLNLNMNVYSPHSTEKQIQELKEKSIIDDEKHKEFSEVVKLEPFRRALEIHQPKLWFTNIRVRQTAYRSSKDILSYSKEGILKVSPFYYWSDIELDAYLSKNNLPKNESYFDPVKSSQNRECGIHLQ